MAKFKSLEGLNRAILHPKQLTDALTAGGTLRMLRFNTLEEQVPFNAVIERDETPKYMFFYELDEDKQTIATLDPLFAYIEVAIWTDEPWLDFPLLPHKDMPEEPSIATIRMMEPKPNMRWKTWINGEPLLGPANRHGASRKIEDALLQARGAGLSIARLEIGTGARAALRGRLNRIKALQTALQGKTINAWSIENNLNYQNVRFAMLRGEQYPEIRAKVAEKVGIPEKELWPNEPWDW